MWLAYIPVMMGHKHPVTLFPCMWDQGMIQMNGALLVVAQTQGSLKADVSQLTCGRIGGVVCCIQACFLQGESHFH